MTLVKISEGTLRRSMLTRILWAVTGTEVIYVRASMKCI